jgi:hypothetical protein
MKNRIVLILAIASFVAVTRLPAPTHHAEQLALVEEEEAELNKVWNETACRGPSSGGNQGGSDCPCGRQEHHAPSLDQ